MLRLAEDVRNSRPARRPVAANASSHVLRTSLLTLAALFAFALPASAAGDLFDELFLQSLGYEDDREPSWFALRRSELLAADALAPDPVESILKYSKPIGNTGLVFRVRAKPSPRRLVRFEIRF